MEATVETITKARAKEYLKLNENFRKLNIRTVRSYAEDFATNKWQSNGESIKFNREGKLIDGQHRLTALLECPNGVTFDSVVVRGVEDDINIDVGLKRSFAQILKREGYKSCTSLAATVSKIRDYAKFGMYRREVMSRAEGLRILEHFPEITTSVKTTMNSVTSVHHHSHMATLHFLIAHFHGFEVAEDYFSKLIEGINLTPDSPVYAVRRRLIKSASSPHSKLIETSAGALIIKGFNLFLADKKVSSVMWREDSQYPKLKGVNLDKLYEQIQSPPPRKVKVVKQN